MDRHVVTANHPAILVMVVLCLHLSWLLGILKITGTDLRKTQYSYGQLLSMFAPVPAIYSFFKILYKKLKILYQTRESIRIWRTFKFGLQYVTDELWYLITGGEDQPHKSTFKSISKQAPKL